MKLKIIFNCLIWTLASFMIGDLNGQNAQLEVINQIDAQNTTLLIQGDPLTGTSTSENATLKVEHYGNGTSLTPDKYKSGIHVITESDDPALLSINNGTGGGYGIYSIGQSSGGGTGVYGDAGDTDGIGDGVTGFGGRIGVLGFDTGITSLAAVWANGDMTAVGAKPFTIDHPLDPENKMLKHFSIESNEVLNLYRGNATLNQEGVVKIQLPDYFHSVNINFTYQLTSIGTATPAYISKEIEDGKFSIGGAPNSKVSWVVMAERNDPTIQYFDNIKNTKSTEVDKPDNMIGKYITPEAYGVPSDEGVFYKYTKKIKEPKE